MNVEAVILYGSRARGDGTAASDTDLIGIIREGDIKKVFDKNETSFHVYPLSWLQESASNGALFLLHLVREALVIYDPDEIFNSIKGRFTFRHSYFSDLEAGSRVVSAFYNMNVENFSVKMRRRYFWGLRTAIMAAAADVRRPVFSSSGLEDFCGVVGLSSHIRHRESATFEECREMGYEAISSMGESAAAFMNADIEDNLRTLFDISGVAGATAGEIIYGF